MVIFSSAAISRDNSKWAQATPERQEFFKKAMRPDLVGKDGVPKSPCCAESDAYEADDFATDKAGNLYAILTCTDPDNCKDYCAAEESIGCRTFRPAGMRIKIRPDAILPPHQPENKTGHGWVFLAGNGEHVFCYAFPSGL